MARIDWWAPGWTDTEYQIAPRASGRPGEWRYETRPAPTRFPHRCPVCDGRGSVPHGFYSGQPLGSSNSATPPAEPCRSCEHGIVWQEIKEGA